MRSGSSTSFRELRIQHREGAACGPAGSDDCRRVARARRRIREGRGRPQDRRAAQSWSRTSNTHVATARVEQGVAASALKRGLGQELEVEWEATGRSARMVVRPSIHPDAEKTLREFAAKVIDGSVIQH